MNLDDFVIDDLEGITLNDKMRLLLHLETLYHLQSGRKIDTYFATEENRAGYKKNLDFFRTGKDNPQRLMLGANRTGKTTCAAYELTCHLTGVYPDWWEGRRFDHSVDVWIAGVSSKTVRDIIQNELLGDAQNIGTGMIPRLAIDKIKKGMGLADIVDTLSVKHINGGSSRVQFKSFEQGRKAFEGTKKDIVWLDEEAPEDVYQECLLRTMTTNGMMMLTFTPLMGMTKLCQDFLKNNGVNGQIVVTITWDDVLHLTKEMKDNLYSKIPAFQRDARTKGIPALGAGAIYPVSFDDFLISPIEIPKHWKRLYALDVGWNNTACLWMAVDPETDTQYIYSEYKQGGEMPFVHAQTIKSRGAWIPGVIDPAARGRGQDDGRRIIDQYEESGLHLSTANNAVEAGLYKVWERLSTGKTKVFNSCVKFVDEFGLYHRDEKGSVVKTHDHIMDCLRYLIMTADQAGYELKKELIDHSPYHNPYARTTL